MLKFLARRRAVRVAADLTAAELVASLGPEKAWHEVKRRRRAVVDGDVENDRALVEVLWAIERRTGYSYFGDTPTRYLGT